MTRLIGNLLWLDCGGLIAGTRYVVAGCALCSTIGGRPIALTHRLFAIILLPSVLGIPFALQRLKLLPPALFPFCYRLGKVVSD